MNEKSTLISSTTVSQNHWQVPEATMLFRIVILCFFLSATLCAQGAGKKESTPKSPPTARIKVEFGDFPTVPKYTFKLELRAIIKFANHSDTARRLKAMYRGKTPVPYAIRPGGVAKTDPEELHNYFLQRVDDTVVEAVVSENSLNWEISFNDDGEPEFVDFPSEAEFIFPMPPDNIVYGSTTATRPNNPAIIKFVGTLTAYVNGVCFAISQPFTHTERYGQLHYLVEITGRYRLAIDENPEEATFYTVKIFNKEGFSATGADGTLYSHRLDIGWEFLPLTRPNSGSGIPMIHILK